MVAAALVIVFGTFGYPGADFAGFIAGALVAMTLFVGAASFVPAAVAIVIAEVFRLRSVFYFVLVGGLIGFAAHEFASFVSSAEFYESRRLVFLAGGFTGGFVYWLIAGIGRAAEAAPGVDDTRRRR